MSEWDQYKVSGSKPLVNEWDQYKVSSPKLKETKKGDAWLPLIGKSAFKGATAIADLPRMAGEGIEAFTSGNPAEVYWAAQDPYATKKPKNTRIEDTPHTNYSKYIPSTADARANLKKYWGLNLEPEPDSPAKRVVSKTVDFGAGMLTPWGFGKKGVDLLKNASSVERANSLLTPFHEAAKRVTGGAAVGLGSGVLQETGVNPLAADLISSVVTPGSAARSKNALQSVFNAPRKIPQKLMGLGPKRLNIKAAQAGRDLDIELPAAVLTDNVLTGLGDQLISKTPILGNVLKSKYDKVHSKTYKHLEDVYKEIGPLDTPEINKKINDLYDASRTARPEDAVVKPFALVKALNDLDRTLVSDISSPDRVKLKAHVTGLKNKLDPTINESVNTSHGKKININDLQEDDINRLMAISPSNKANLEEYLKKAPTTDLPMQDYPVNKLIDAKVNLNDIINHDVKGDALNRLTEIKHAVDAELAKYGETNPEWYKKLKEADLLYGNVAKRKNTEKRLRNQATLEDDGDLSFAALNNTINNRENRRLLKRDLPPDTYDKLLKIGRISQAMVQKNRRVPNPSGTATTMLSLAYMGQFWLDPISTLSGTGAAAIGGALGTTRLLTNKKFLDSALKFAEANGKHKMKAAMDLNKTTKDITGYTLNSIYRAAHRDNKEESDGLQQP